MQIAQETNAKTAVPTPAPEGVVSLVFTDVESSTAQWEFNPEAMVGKRNSCFFQE
jgi:hypothetical protein